MPPKLVDAGALKAMLADGQELAIVDLREELIFSRGHLLFARSVPLSRLELKFARLVPRRGTRIVLCDDADDLCERAADILARAGYTNLHALAGGVAAWAAAGFELFSGVNVPSKAFGEFVEHASATPSIDAAELERLMRERGDMGWTLAGFDCDSGKARRAGDVSREGLAWAKAAAERVARRFGVARIDLATVERWRSDDARTLYLFDVRDPREYDAAHVAGAISAPGGQLVQAADQYAGTLGARIVLIDPAEVRAVMTASWLRQMGWRDVYVLAQAGRETAPPAAQILGNPPPSELRIDCADLAALIARNAATVVDLSASRDYLRAHIPGAWFAIRSRLERAPAKVPLQGTLVLTCEDGVLAGRAAIEARALVDRPVRALEGGNAAWLAAGYALTADDAKMADEAVDAWLKPYERPHDKAAAMREYLSWEIDLPARIARDGSANFLEFQP